MTPRHALSLVASLLLAAACDDATTCATSADCFQGELCSAEGKCRELMADMSGPDLATDMDSPDLPPDMAQDMAQDMAPDLEPDLPPDMEPDLEPDLPPDMDSAGCQGVMCGPGTCVASDNGVARCSCPAGYDDSNPLRCRPIPTHVAAGGRHTCAIAAGALYCWGDNSKGQLGLGDQSRRDVPTPVPDMGSGVTAVVAGSRHTCAIKGRMVHCWGDNSSGQLGLGSLAVTSSATPQPIMLTDAAALAAGDFHTCAIDAGVLHCWGDDSEGQIGDGQAGGFSTSPSPVTAEIGNSVAVVSGGAAHTCAINTNGRLYCWGFGGDYRLGLSDVTSHATPQVVANDALTVAAGSAHTCAILSGSVRCWGNNSQDQLGDSSRADPTEITQITLDNAGGLLASGDRHTCATQRDILYCWGANDSGQGGIGMVTTSLGSPNIIAGATMPAALDAGDQHTCAIYNRLLACWGDNTYGQLGLGNGADPVEPSPSAPLLP